MSEAFDVVIVGGGPRGVATTLRIAARVGPGEPPVRVAMIDAVQVGAGATWWTAQPGAYLNNTLASATTIHPDDSTPMSGPPAPGPDLLDWAADAVRAGGHPEGEWVLAEATGLRGDDFPTRRLQGVYFRDRLAAAVAGGTVEVTEVHDTAIDLLDDGQEAGLRGVLLRGGRRLWAPTVVLAQGMVQARPDDEVARLLAAADADPRLRYVPPGMPAERDVSGLPAGENVLVRGLGANFFDVVGQWVQEWGGAFEPVPGDPTGRLRYLPSGREPRLVAGSRRGLPYRSKPDAGVPRADVELRWATPEWFDALAARDHVDFRDEVWPVLARELAAAWLRTLATTGAGDVADDWQLRLAEAGTLEAVENVLATVVGDPAWAWQLDHLRRPTGGRPVTPAQWDALLARHVAEELGSMSTPATHPRAAVDATMGALRARVGRLVRAGVFEGESFVRDVRGWFDGDGLFLASGPPPQRVRLVLALLEAGVLELIGPGMQVDVDVDAGAFTASSPITGRTASARTLVETRMSKGKVPTTDDPLLRALLDSGRARIHHVDGVATASMEATPAVVDEAVTCGHNLVAADGRADPGVIVLGIPADTTQPGSAIGATPGVPSPLLAGADIAAKQVLARRA